MISEIPHILNFKVRSVLKRSLEWRIENVVRNAASIVVFGGFTVVVFLMTRSTTEYLLNTAHLGLFLVHRFLSMLLFVFFVSINVGNMIVFYATLYRSQETSYFLTTPISHVSLFVVKFIDNFFYSSAALFLIAFAVLLGYGSYFHMSSLFYVQTLFFMFIPFMIIAACVAVMTLVVLMKYSTRVGTKNILASLVVVYLGLMFIYFKITNPVQLVFSVLQNYPRLDDYFGNLDPFFAKYLPSHWIAESLYWTMRGNSTYALTYTVMLVMVAGLAFIGMVTVAKKLFYSSWLSSLELSTSPRTQTPWLRLFSLMRPARLEPQTSVLMKKEFWLFIREPSQWIHLGIIATLVITFMVSVSRIDLRQTLPFMQTVSYLVVLLFNAFLIASIALRFVYPMVSTEGQNFWRVLSAPVSREKIFRLKWLFAFIPIVAVSELLVIFSHRSIGEYSTLFISSCIIMAGVSLALVCLNLGAGAFFVNFKEKNPIRLASSQSATLTFLVSIGYLTLVVSVMFVPFNDFFSSIIRRTAINEGTIYYGVLIISIVSAAISTVSVFIGLRSLNRDF